MNRTLQTVLITCSVVIAIAAALALVGLAASQLWPATSSARIQWGEHSTALANVFDSGVLEFMVAWAAVTLAILIAVAATVFALSLSAILLGGIAVMMGLPLILIGLFAWWMVRRNRRTPSPLVSAQV